MHGQLLTLVLDAVELEGFLFSLFYFLTVIMMTTTYYFYNWEYLIIIPEL